MEGKEPTSACRDQNPRNIIFFIRVVCLVLVLQSQAVGETLTLVADEWPPFNGVPNSSQEGYIVDVARAVFEDQGIRVDYQVLPWRRAVEMTRDGMYNGVIGASKTDAPGFIFPEEELSRNFLSFYVRKGFPWRFTRPSDVEQVSLAVIAGYDYRQWLLGYIDSHRDNPDRIQVMTGNTPLERNLKKLINGRVDAVVDNEAVILNLAVKMGITHQIMAAGYGSEPSYIYIAFSPKKPQSGRYAKMLTHGVTQLRQSGKLAKILMTYGLKDWKSHDR
ncbi:MAG: hypothetical protein D3926_04855 [Desulfobacteraceae bacterium]|nr:MAG: hypothetical protein D3926_04855 [Desulfobacteraceae bacterium]